jgi:14-3-3 protein epsilon
MKLVLSKFNDGLQVEERNLISVAYKNRTNALRNSWRIVDALETVETSRASSPSARNPCLIRKARQKIEQELLDVCQDILQLLDASLIPRAKDPEERVFYSKMYVMCACAA